MSRNQLEIKKKKADFYWLWNIKDKRIKNMQRPAVKEIWVCETTKEKETKKGNTQHYVIPTVLNVKKNIIYFLSITAHLQRPTVKKRVGI